MISEAITVEGKSGTRFRLLGDAELLVVPGFLSPAETDGVWAACESLKWEHQLIMGVWTLRRNAWLADDPAWTYEYSRKVWNPRPLPAQVASLGRRVGDLFGIDFNAALVTDYPDGRAAVGWHADDEAEFGRDPPVASVSIGVPRVFQLLAREKKPHPRATPDLEIELTDGALALTRGSFQHRYRHALKKASERLGRRINLSYRHYVGPVRR